MPADLARVTGIATGGAHCLALQADGTVRVWASVPGTYSNTNIPPGLSGVRAVAAGDFHSLALTAESTVIAWGNNSYGQTNVPADLSNVVAVAAAGWHSLALKADGTLLSWGSNGDGITSLPPGISNVTGIACLSPDDLFALEIQASINLHDWTTPTGAGTLTNGSLLIRDQSSRNFPQRFYRIIEH